MDDPRQSDFFPAELAAAYDELALLAPYEPGPLEPDPRDDFSDDNDYAREVCVPRHGPL